MATNNTNTEFNPEFSYTERSVAGKIIAWVIRLFGGAVINATTTTVDVSITAAHAAAVAAYKKKKDIDELTKIVEKFGD